MARKTWESKFKAGDKAPQFEAVVDDGTTISSEELKGKKTVLFFYSADGTPTCTVEACNIRDNYGDLQQKGYQVFGVSKDSVRKHQNFKAKHELPYPLIADKDNMLAKTFDIFGEKKFMGRVSEAAHRTTFVIDEDWTISKVIHPVNSKDHAAEILA